MSDTTTALTTNYELKKPAQGGSLNHWGTELNTNFDTIDTKLVPTSTTTANGGQVLTASSTAANTFSWEDAGGGATTFPFYKANGNPDTIAITSGEFPFFKANGNPDNIGVS